MHVRLDQTRNDHALRPNDGGVSIGEVGHVGGRSDGDDLSAGNCHRLGQRRARHSGVDLGEHKKVGPIAHPVLAGEVRRGRNGGRNHPATREGGIDLMRSTTCSKRAHRYSSRAIELGF